MNSILAALDQMCGAKNLVLCHDQADSDAVGAAYAVQRWIGGDIAVPVAVATHTHQLVERLGIEVLENPDLAQYENIVLVDCANPIQLGACMPKQYCLIDHHVDNCLIQGAVSGFYEVKTSTCQLVYRLYKESGKSIDTQIAIALCAGIMTDTINFHKGDDEAFRAFGELLALGGITYDEIQALYGINERSDRGAIIESALRAKKFTFNGYHILATDINRNIPTFAARALFDLGADISIVGFQREQDVEIRMYLRQEIADTHRFGAGDLFQEVSKQTGAKVWGYQLFAGYRGAGNLQDVLELLIIIVEKRLTSVFKQ